MNEENIMLLLLEKSGRARGQTRGASEDSSKKKFWYPIVWNILRTSSLPPMLSTDTKSGRDISRPHLIHRLHPTVMDFSPLPSPINSVKCPVGSSSSPPSTATFASPPPTPVPPPVYLLPPRKREAGGKEAGGTQREPNIEGNGAEAAGGSGALEGAHFGEGGREERRPVLLSRGRRERREGERKREFLSMRGIPFSVPLPSPTLQ